MAVGVCLLLAAAASAAPVFVPTQHFTLAWTHSIEKTRWEEDYAILPSEPPRLIALSARIRGSGAGMEPPDGSRLHDGWFEYKPMDRLPAELRLSRSGFVPDYDWCMKGRCQSLGHWLPSDDGVTLVRPCRVDDAMLAR